MLADLLPKRGEQRSSSGLSWPDYLRLFEEFGFNGTQYVIPGGNLGELTAMQAQRNPIVWAAIAFRLMIFSEVRFAFQGWQAGRPGDLSVDKSLQILEHPWPQATTGDLLARMEVDASLYGNSYWVRPPGADQLVRLTPTRTTIATTDVIDAVSGNPYGKVLVGYFLNDDRGNVSSFFLPNEVAHYRPIPDPAHEFRGISWMNSLIPDIQADLALSDYKHSFVANSATPSLAVSFAPGISQEAFDKFKDKMESAHTGPQTAGKTLYLGAGADVKVIGSDFQGLLLNDVQAAGETRIAAAAGVPPTLLSLSEGMKGSALNAGNYLATRRRFSDGTMRPLWRSVCGSLSTIAPPPAGSRLWYDGRDVPFLQEDIGVAAANRTADSATMLNLINSGFEPDSVVKAVATGDFTQLRHSGLVSVQLQPPTAVLPPDPPALPAGDSTEEGQ